MNKAFLHQQTFLRRMSNTNQTSNTSSVFRMTLQSKSQNSKPSSSVCALCFHSLWRVRMQLIKVFWHLERSSTLSSSFIQNLHEGFSRSIAWPDERISSRALGGMPRSLKFWLLDNCSISFKMLLLMKQYFEYKILCFESVSFPFLDLGILQS